IYAYRLNRTASNKRLEKSVDGGYNWFFIPNTLSLQDVVFKASTPYSKAKIVSVSLKTDYPKSKISKTHQFLVKIRKEKEIKYVISGINFNNNIVQYTIGYGNNWQSFSNTSNRTSLNSLNIDTFVASYNSAQPIRISTNNMYQLWLFNKQNYNSNFVHDYLDTATGFSRGITTTSPGSDRDWLKVTNVGNYLYVAYAVVETLYTPSTGTWEDYYSVYFAYKKLVQNYWINNIRINWLKKRVFSIRRAQVGGINGDIRFVRFVYGAAAGNNFHITFCAGTSSLQPNVNQFHNDFYYLGSPDGKNWTVVNIDKTLVAKGIITSDTINPLFVVPIVGGISGTTNQLHFVFIDWFSNAGQDQYRIAYLSTNDLNTFSSIQYLNNTNPTYRTNINRPFTCETLRDFDAMFYNNSIYIILSGEFRSVGNSEWNGPRDKIALLFKNNFSGPAVYNVHPTGNNGINFQSASLSIGNNYVHILSNDGSVFYYLRQQLSNVLTIDLVQSIFANNENSMCIDSFHSGRYLHVSFYNVSSQDLDYYRISNPVNPSFTKIGSLSIDDNLVNTSNSVDGEQLLSSDNIDNGVMNGITIGSDGYLHFLTHSMTSSSLGEVIYTDPNSNTLTANNRFDTLLIHDTLPYYRSINADINLTNDFRIITFTDNSGN
ncbi:MAG: hypothetical protein NZM44_03550, partial [Candidatus Calescibacterium sp.]|nr:hypothetical protein [Candidatus Calescibacterium sp.]